MRIRIKNKHYSNSINSNSFEDFAFILSGTLSVRSGYFGFWGIFPIA